MKSKNFIVVSLLVALCFGAKACGLWYYDAGETDIYRLLPYGKEGPDTHDASDFLERNLLLWARQTGIGDTAAIRRALYGDCSGHELWARLLPVARRGAVAALDAKALAPLSSNSFVRRLVATRDTDAVRLLCWSMRYSAIRNAQRSPWYYEGSNTPEVQQLRALCGEVRRHGFKGRYAARYAFLAVKCSWAVGDHNATVALWHELEPTLGGTLFHPQAADYAARSLCALGRTNDAYAIYLANGDLASHLRLQSLSLPELLEVLLAVNPESELIPIELQRMLFMLENNPFALSHTLCTMGYQADTAVLRIAQQAARTTVRSRRAMWGYTAACLLDYRHRHAEALMQLQEVSQLPADPFLRNSIRVLRFYLRTKTAVVDPAFEQYAMGELKWMDDELQREWGQLHPKERYRLSRIAGSGTSEMRRSCYMYDAMRRILLPDSVGLCHRMVQSGRAVRALQMANMAENYLFLLADNPVMKAIRRHDASQKCRWECDYGERDGFNSAWLSWFEPDTCSAPGCHEYWRDMVSFNGHDYSNWMFLLADRLAADTLALYCHRLAQPADDIDRWFNARGYTDADYWHDIVGTHYLRECNYAAAAGQLRQVSPRYQRLLNVRCLYSPFGYTHRLRNTDTTGYKLHFAESMVQLQRQMFKGSRDSRGLAMLEYSIGMRNSFGLCWYLTAYGKVNLDYDNLPEWWEGTTEQAVAQASQSLYPVARLTGIHHPYKTRGTAKASQLQHDAFLLLRSAEARARYYARLGLTPSSCSNTPTPRRRSR